MLQHILEHDQSQPRPMRQDGAEPCGGCRKLARKLAAYVQSRIFERLLTVSEIISCQHNPDCRTRQLTENVPRNKQSSKFTNVDQGCRSKAGQCDCSVILVQTQFDEKRIEIIYQLLLANFSIKRTSGMV